MAKGDHNRSQNKIDEQGSLAQNYLAQTQGQLGNQYGNLYNMYMGPNARTFGNTNNMGSTTANYSLYNNPFQGNQSGQSQPNNPFGSSYGGGTNTNDADYKGEFNSAVQKLGIAPQQFRSNPQVMDQVTNYLNQQYPGQGWSNGGARAGDWVGVGGQGMGFDVLPAGDANWQFNPDPANGYGGGGGGGGFGGVPGMQLGDYSNIMGQYGSMLPRFSGLYDKLSGQYGGLIGSASNMAQTGGLSEQDKANLRARAISPIRSVYAQGLQDLSRQKAIQGGYSPGFTTALGRFNRQQGQQTSDATTNAEAAIAQMVQQGKIAGLGAWGSALGGESSGLLGSLGGMNQSIGGMSNLYGQTPGLINTMGNQMLAASGQQLEAAKLQNELGLGVMGATNYLGANVPGNTAGTLANAKTAMGLMPGVGGGIVPWLRDHINAQNGTYAPWNGQTGSASNVPDINDPSLIDGGYGNPIPGEVYGGSSMGPIMNAYNPYTMYQQDNGTGTYDPYTGNTPSNYLMPEGQPEDQNQGYSGYMG